MITSSSRQTILDRLRVRPIEPSEHPEIDYGQTVYYPNPLAKFEEILTWVGGRVHYVDELSQVQSVLSQLPEYSSAKWIASTVPDAVPGNFSLAQVDDPHWLASLDWSIIQGEFGVAENGAIWVPAANLNERTMVFIAQHLAIIVSRSQMVTHMHDAYTRVKQSALHQANQPRFGVFVSGPSKTADIEQSLVLGAHGCRTLEVFLTP
jgi:L-lactate dehydrogenase complex protein LldG